VLPSSQPPFHHQNEVQYEAIVFVIGLLLGLVL
jgi:hypothetical protein